MSHSSEEPYITFLGIAALQARVVGIVSGRYVSCFANMIYLCIFSAALLLPLILRVQTLWHSYISSR